MASDGDPPPCPSWFLVSGGSGGIGAQVCLALAQRGYRPIVGYCSGAAAAEQVARNCAGTALQLDLRDAHSIHSAAEYLETAPRLAGVVLAGSPPPSLAPFSKVTSEELQAQLEVNVLGPQRLLAELVRRCFRKHKQGHVIGILSQAMGDAQSPAAAGMGAYVIAKHAMAGMLALLAADYPWLQVRSVRPSYTETRMLSVFDERFLALQRERTTFLSPVTVAEQIVSEVTAP